MGYVHGGIARLFGGFWLLCYRRAMTLRLPRLCFYAALLLVNTLAPRAQAQQPAGEKFADEVKDLTYIGFEETDSAVRVFVRTSEQVKYTVDTSHARRVVIILDNCRVPVFNNTRPLDTQYFSGPVTRIEAKPVGDLSPSVRIEVELRQQAPMRPTQKDTTLALDFAKG
jgi:hypothetical protein